LITVVVGVASTGE